MIKIFLTDTRGTATIEYVMIAASLAVALLTALGQVGGGVAMLYDQVAAR